MVSEVSKWIEYNDDYLINLDKVFGISRESGFAYEPKLTDLFSISFRNEDGIVIFKDKYLHIDYPSPKDARAARDTKFLELKMLYLRI